MRHRMLPTLVVMALVGASCTRGTITPTVTPPTTSASSPTPATGVPMSSSSFATLQDVPLLGDTPVRSGPLTRTTSSRSP